MAYQNPISIRPKQRLQQEMNAKAIIRMATVFFAVIALIIEAAFKNNNPGLFDEDSGYLFFLYPQSFVSVSYSTQQRMINATLANERIVKLVVAVFWSGAELIFLKFKNRSMHPGTMVAIDLLIFLGLMSATIVWLMLDTWPSHNNFSTSLAQAAAAFFVIVS